MCFRSMSFSFYVVLYYCVDFADKDRELGEAQAEIKALRFSERLREKAVEEVFSNIHLCYFHSKYCIFFSYFSQLILSSLLSIYGIKESAFSLTGFLYMLSNFQF